jgi:chromosome segregation ATPase
MCLCWLRHGNGNAVCSLELKLADLAMELQAEAKGKAAALAEASSARGQTLQVLNERDELAAALQAMEERLASQQEHLLGMSKDLIEAQLEREHSNKSLESALAEIVKLKWELRAAQGAKTSAQEKASALERHTSQLSGDLTSAQEKASALERHTSQLSGELQSVNSHSLELKSFIKQLHAKTVVLSWRRLLRSLQLHTAGSALLLSLIQMRRHALQEICESEAEVLLRTIKLDNMRKRLERIPPPNSKPTDPPRAMVLAHEWVSTADYTSLHGQWRRMRTAGQGQFGLLPALEPTRGAKMTPGELYHAAALARAKLGTIRGNRPGSRNSGQLGV